MATRFPAFEGVISGVSHEAGKRFLMEAIQYQKSHYPADNELFARVLQLQQADLIFKKKT